MAKNIPIGNSQFIIYQTESGKTKVGVRLENETVWLTQTQMADLFDKGRSTIAEHIQNIFVEEELEQSSVCRKYRQTAEDGKNYDVLHYNLDVIISVGYRVRSVRGTRFRQWATEKLRDYIVKGFVLDDERLKNPDHPFDYFDELLRRIQDIRTSEKRFYQKITDIYATSADYDPMSEMSINFFKTVQNKLHWAITHKTAAEIIYNRADSNKANMGLTAWRGDKVRKADVSIAKNYLEEEELLSLNNLVEQYLVFAEGQARRRITMNMKDWLSKLEGFLSLNDRDILDHAGKISHDLAVSKAESEYEKFSQIRITQSDKEDGNFEEAVKLIQKKEKK